MKKQTREFKINYDLDWEYNVEISKLREDLDAIEKLGATHVSIDAYVSYDCDNLEISPISRRLETDEEYNARIVESKGKEYHKKLRDLEELRRLKLKYE